MNGMTGNVAPQGLTEAEQKAITCLVRGKRGTAVWWVRENGFSVHNWESLVNRPYGRKDTLSPKLAEIARALVRDGFLVRNKYGKRMP